VPYVHEYRLGIRTTELDAAAIRSEFAAAFARLYRELASHAQGRFPAAPLVATGHLTLGLDATRADYPQEIHQVGTIEGLPVDLLDPRIRYAALGHIHRCYPVRRPSAWYSGSPIAYSLTETRQPRRVLLVDLDAEPAVAVTPIEVPHDREMVEIVGSPAEVEAALGALAWSTRLPPLVHVTVVSPVAEPGLPRRLHEALAGHDAQRRPVLVEVRQQSPACEGRATPVCGPSLEELEPSEVFARLCDAEQLEGDTRARLEAAFATLASASDETLEQMVTAIDGSPPGLGTPS
jgi:exonuclease SbcD